MSTKLPSFQFYPGDWQKEPTLRCISHASKGVYIDMLCLMFECEDRGVLATGGKPWSNEQIAAAVGGDRNATVTCIDELLAMGVVCRNQSGAIFSRRMVRDEQDRKHNAERQRRFKAKAKGNAIGNGVVTPPEVEDEVEDKSSSEEKDELFEKFWSVFPRLRRKSKAKAREAWLRAIDRAEPKTIIDAAIEYANSRDGRGTFVKMPATWLNGDCWEDDREAWNADLDSSNAQVRLSGDANRKAAERAAKKQHEQFARERQLKEAEDASGKFESAAEIAQRLGAKIKFHP